MLASHFANHIPVICPSGLLRSTNSFLMNLSYNSERKVTKRTPPQSACPSGPLTIRLCLRAALTRRPGSTRLNPTSMSDFPYQSRMPRQTSRGDCHLPLSSPKTASLVGSIDHGRSIESCRAWMRVKTARCSLDVTKWNPGLFKATGNSRITLRFIQATSMRSTSARGVFLWLLSLYE